MIFDQPNMLYGTPEFFPFLCINEYYAWYLPLHTPSIGENVHKQRTADSEARTGLTVSSLGLPYTT